jgi:hypothetical protein
MISISTKNLYIIHAYQASGDADADAVEGRVSDVEPAGMDPKGIFLLGRFSSSIVTPSNFVMPMTGASPFFTNSYMPINGEQLEN